ncbi:MAG: ABC transporter permease [Candidatus Woesearchaeota archaeon]
MKLTKIIKKNFKLLMRSKITAVVVVLGPLLIIGLVGFAFNNNAISQFNIAIYTPDNSGLTQSFIFELKNNNFNVYNFSTKDSCIDSVRQGVTHTCIVFPENFVVEKNRTKEVVFFADYSRTNFVNTIINNVMTNLNMQTGEVSKSLTTKILNSLDFVQTTNQQILLDLIRVKESLDKVESNIDSFYGKLEALDVEAENIGFNNLLADLDEIQTSVNDLKNRCLSMKSTGLSFVNYAANFSNLNASYVSETQEFLNNAEQEFIQKYNETKNNIDALISTAGNTSKKVDQMKQKLDNVKQFKSISITVLEEIKKTIASLKEDVSKIKASIETINDNIEGIEIKSAEQIIKPISTHVEPIQGKSTNLGYMFPYILILIIMFVSLLLSSTLVVLEKKSKAQFRIFTTPTSDFLFIIGNYLTNVFVMFLQVIVILGIAYFFLRDNLFTNIELTVLVLLLTILLFVAIGLCIGYLFSSQEAAIMVSVTLGCVLLFVSNIILPMESMPAYIQEIAIYNPYVMLSELLRKFMLFHIGLEVYYNQIAIIVSLCVIFLMLILIIQKIGKMRYLSNKPKNLRMRQKKELLKRTVSLLESKNLDNLEKLIEFIKNMSEEEFSKIVNKDMNALYEYGKQNIKNKEICGALNNNDKKKILYCLDLYMKKKRTHK